MQRDKQYGAPLHYSGTTPLPNGPDGKPILQSGQTDDGVYPKSGIGVVSDKEKKQSQQSRGDFADWLERTRNEQQERAGMHERNMAAIYGDEWTYKPGESRADLVARRQRLVQDKQRGYTIENQDGKRIKSRYGTVATADTPSASMANTSVQPNQAMALNSEQNTLPNQPSSVSVLPSQPTQQQSVAQLTPNNSAFSFGQNAPVSQSPVTIGGFTIGNPNGDGIARNQPHLSTSSDPSQ